MFPPNDEIVLNINGMSINLDSRCPNCGYDYFDREKENCKYCNGSGFELTEEGRAIFELLKRHGGKNATV